eukprot:565940-Amphidinium_carterae.1
MGVHFEGALSWLNWLGLEMSAGGLKSLILQGIDAGTSGDLLPYIDLGDTVTEVPSGYGGLTEVSASIGGASLKRTLILIIGITQSLPQSRRRVQ